jgi:hypothetical protein
LEYVERIRAPKDLFQSDDIWMVQAFQDIELAKLRMELRVFSSLIVKLLPLKVEIVSTWLNRTFIT